jgi:hypothetical protein
MVTEEENARLEEKFTESEIKRVVFESYPDGAQDQMPCLSSFIKSFGSLSRMT